MSVIINGDTGIDKITDGSVVQADLASGVTTTGPAFSAYIGSTQNISDATWTKMECDTEEFDTNSNYDSTTNYRFTPTVAGYYQVNGQTQFSGSTGRVNIGIWKNGSAEKTGCGPSNFGGSTTIMMPNVSALIYMNGTTDYIELYAWQNGGNTETLLGGFSTNSYFQAFLARAA